MQRLRSSKLLQFLLWLTGAALIWLTLRTIPLGDVGQTLQRLNILQLIVLAFVNLLVIFSLSGRWWWILRSMGIEVPYPLISAYRLAAFSVSYFTPGPQFGGEPLQVYLLNRRHAVPGSKATAAVTLDKAIELIGNFTFLAFGLLITIQVQFFTDNTGELLLYIALGILLAPLILLGVVWSGKTPLTALMHSLPEKLKALVPGFMRIQTLVVQTEEQISAFCCDRPQGLIGALGFSLATWALLLSEYWLMNSYLDLNLGLWEVVSVLTIARLAFLTPLPGGLGALEAGQAFALSALGYSVSEGFSLGLLIRARDLAFGGLGLLLAYLFGRKPSQGITPVSKYTI